MSRKRNICEKCLREKNVRSFSHSYVPIIATCFYCRKVNQDGFYIYEENIQHAKTHAQEKPSQIQKA